VAREKDINRFGESVAANSGARLRVLRSAEEALRWVEDGPPG
jgi:hypothetical protein